MINKKKYNIQSVVNVIFEGITDNWTEKKNYLNALVIFSSFKKIFLQYICESFSWIFDNILVNINLMMEEIWVRCVSLFENFLWKNF